MSSSISSSSPTPTGRCGNLYDTPIRDAVCAMPYNDRNKGYMASCCGDADIVSYYDDCGLYCLAEGQEVQELSSCLYDEGAKWEDVFCRGDEDATATGSGKALPSASERVVDSDERKKAEDSKDDDDDDDDDKGNDENSEDEGEDSGASGRIGVLGVVFGLTFCCATILGL